MAAATTTMNPTLLLASITYFATQIGRLQAKITDLYCEQDTADALRLSTRTADCLNERKIAVIKLAKGLKKQPDLVVLQLEQTAEGCDWLISRWKHLALAFVEDRDADWDETDREVALDLIGVAHDLRKRCLLLGPDGPEGTSQRMMIAHHQIDRLNFRKTGEGLNQRAQEEYEAEILGHLRTPDANQKRIARELLAAERSLRFAMKQLKHDQAQSEDSEEPETEEAPVEPKAAPQAKPAEPTREEILDELDAIDEEYDSDPEGLEAYLLKTREGLLNVLKNGIYPDAI